MKHILAIAEEDLIYNLDTNTQEYKTKIIISEDVFNWLNIHDLEITSKGQKIFIVNNIKYIYIGIYLEIEDLK